MSFRASLGALEVRPFRLLWLTQTTSAAGVDATLVGAAVLAVAANLALLALPDVWRIRAAPPAVSAIAT